MFETVPTLAEIALNEMTKIVGSGTKPVQFKAKYRLKIDGKLLVGLLVQDDKLQAVIAPNGRKPKDTTLVPLDSWKYDDLVPVHHALHNTLKH